VARSIAELEARVAWLTMRVRQGEAVETREYAVGKFGAELGVTVTTPCVAHPDLRAAVAAAMGPKPAGAKLMSRCATPGCATYDHLYWGTASDTARDRMLIAGRAKLSEPALVRWRGQLADAQHELAERLSRRRAALEEALVAAEAWRQEACVHVKASIGRMLVKLAEKQLGGPLPFRRCGDLTCVCVSHMASEELVDAAELRRQLSEIDQS
jgi:hypothetical protein